MLGWKACSCVCALFLPPCEHKLQNLNWNWRCSQLAYTPTLSPANSVPVSNNWDWWLRAASYLKLLCNWDKESNNVPEFSFDLFCIGCIWVGLGIDPAIFESKGLQRFIATGNWASTLLEVCAAAGLTLFSSPWSSQLSTHPHHRTEELRPGLGHLALRCT